MPPRAKKTTTSKAGKRYPLNMRTTHDVRKKLEKAAELSGRSLTQEAEYRIDRSFLDDDAQTLWIREVFGTRELYGIMRIIATSMRDAADQAGFFVEKDFNEIAWLNDPYAFQQAREAVVEVLEALAPPGDPAEGANRAIKLKSHSSAEADTLRDWMRTLGRSLATVMIVEAARGKSHNGSPVEESRAREIHRDLGKLAERLQRSALRPKAPNPKG